MYNNEYRFWHEHEKIKHSFVSLLVSICVSRLTLVAHILSLRSLIHWLFILAFTFFTSNWVYDDQHHFMFLVFSHLFHTTTTFALSSTFVAHTSRTKLKQHYIKQQMQRVREKISIAFASLVLILFVFSHLMLLLLSPFSITLTVL